MRQVFFDTETTGLHKDSKIVEIAAIEAVNGKPTGKTLHLYFNPQQSMDAEVIEVHGLTNEMLKDKPLFKEKAVEIKEFLRGAEIIAHNISFDLERLNYEFSLIEPGFEVRTLADKITDTYTDVAARVLSGKIKKFNLDALMKFYGIPPERRPKHSAMLDTEILVDVYNCMLEGIDLSAPRLDQDVPRSPVQRLSTTTSLPKVELTAQEIEAEQVYFNQWKGGTPLAKKRMSL